MLPGIGGGEWIVIAIVALVVVGPKNLPPLLRQLGKFVGKMRAMADDFKASFDDMARQSELDELRKEVEALRSSTSTSSVVNDVKNQLNAIESDIKDSVRRTGEPAPDPGLNHVIDNPQFDGLPPKWDATVAPDNAPPSVLTDAVLPEAGPVIVKKPRARKPRTEAVAVAEPVAEPAPAKRQRRKTVS
ncbi:MAG: twin-arginine translocase subunit TatB [Asticcacaulis sp.]|nr:twin-arginine translocase subunit TatB [Asticcacaulis sp.]